MNKTLIALGLALASSAAVADRLPVTVVLNSSSTMTQGMAMVLANQMQEQGGQVDVLLCDKAGDLALKGADGEVLMPNKVTPAQLLEAVIKKGGTASVCALYLPNSGNKADALKDGISAAKPDAMGRAMLEPGRKVIGF